MTFSWLRIVRGVWLVAPALVLGAVLLFLWMKPSPGSDTYSRGQITVAGEEALTPKARKWKKRPPAPCEDTAGEFRVVTRELTTEEEQAIARKYGAVFEIVPLRRSLNLDANSLAIARVFGEYAAPRLRYGGTMLASVLVNGEFEGRYLASSAPKFGWLGVYGVGGFYDLTSNADSTGFNPVTHHRVYAFLEPFQTKQVYWRIEGGALQVADDWDPYAGVLGEWRSEPTEWKWLRRLRTGLRGPN